MRKLIRLTLLCAGTVVLAACFLWCFVAPFSSARNLITADSEFEGYCFSMVGVVVGCALCVVGLPGKISAQASCFLLSLVLFSLTIVTWAYLSDREFAYWKLRWISGSEWGQMKSDLLARGAEAIRENENEISLSGHTIPQGLRKLGLRADGFFGAAQSGEPSLAYTNEIVYLLCGDRSRTWGLFVGPEVYVKERWPHFACTPVSQNAYFVIGTND